MTHKIRNSSRHYVNTKWTADAVKREARAALIRGMIDHIGQRAGNAHALYAMYGKSFMPNVSYYTDEMLVQLERVCDFLGLSVSEFKDDIRALDAVRFSRFNRQCAEAAEIYGSGYKPRSHPKRAKWSWVWGWGKRQSCLNCGKVIRYPVSDLFCTLRCEENYEGPST